MTQNELMDIAESGKILVFPTEESARAFSTRYVIERKKGLLASSCIAFDSFAAIFMPSSAGKVQIRDEARLLFSSYISSVLADQLEYFVSPEYPEIKARLASFFRPILPNLDDAIALPKKSRKAESDLRLLRREYGKFLDAMGLYEGSFVPFSIPDTLSDDYVLVMPSAFPKEDRLIKALDGASYIEIIDDLVSEIPSLVVYQNEKSEIRSLFLEIRKLIKSGVTLDEIAIASASLDRVRPYLEQEAYLFGIPLDFREGLTVLSTSAGSFLSSLSEIYSSSYSLDSLKAFFLNPSIPFKEPEVMRSFIAAAVGYSITSAPDRKNDRYMKLSKSYGQEYYKALRFTLDKLMTETDPGMIESYIHALMSALLVDEEFHGNSEDEAVYSFAMKALSDFLRSAKEAIECGYASTEPLFPLFITYLGKLKYVPREREKGVSVYPFTQDAAVPFKYRFIIGLNEKEGTELVKKASFLSDYELSSERDEDDITRTLLSLYSAMTENLVLSASYETYAGFSLPLTFMLGNARNGILETSDPILAEELGGLPSEIMPLQKLGYENAIGSSLRRRLPDDDMTYKKMGKKRDKPVTLSYSSYNVYIRCPYQYALQYAFDLRNLPSYEPVDMDHLEIGSRLHSILERYYREGCLFPDDDIPRLFDEEMGKWSNGVRSDGEDMPLSASRPTHFLISYLRAKYLDKLRKVVKWMDEISDPLPDRKGLEEKIVKAFPEYGFSIDGRVDRIAISTDGSSYIVYDYKKGRAFQSDLKKEKSFQFHIYRMLIDEDENFTLPVSDSYFISLLDGKFTPSSPSPSRDELKERLKEAADGISSGDWHAIASDTNCKGCIYKGICRRRFSVR